MAKINWKSTADRLGVTLDDVEQLIAGRATANLCQQIGLYPADIDDFIRAGFVSANVASQLNLGPLAAVDELAKALGREGRIGLFVGLLFGRVGP
jgi:hypothetical protein